MTKPKFKLRGIHPLTDTKYIKSSWYLGVQDNDPTHKLTPPPVLSHHLNRVIDWHIQDSSWLILTLDRGKGADGTPLQDAWMSGFVCFTHTEASPTIHYVYLRNRYRGHKLGRYLLESALSLSPPDVSDIVYYSTVTNQARRWAERHTDHNTRKRTYLGKQWLYNPYALTYNMPQGWYL